MDFDDDDIIELLPAEFTFRDTAPPIVNDTTTENEILATQLLLFTDGPTLVMHDFRHHDDTIETVRRVLTSESMSHIKENFWMLDVLAKA